MAFGLPAAARLQAIEQGQRIVAAGGQEHLEAQRLQPACDQLAVALFVVHHQHPLALALIAV